MRKKKKIIKFLLIVLGCLGINANAQQADTTNIPTGVIDSLFKYCDRMRHGSSEPIVLCIDKYCQPVDSVNVLILPWSKEITAREASKMKPRKITDQSGCSRFDTFNPRYKKIIGVKGDMSFSYLASRVLTGSSNFMDIYILRSDHCKNQKGIRINLHNTADGITK